MIVVTGANGTLGRSVTERLLDRVPADQLAVSVREPDLSEGLRERGVRVRRGDFADPASLADALGDAARTGELPCPRTGRCPGPPTPTSPTPRSSP